jgi:hypothetical protein
MPPPSVQSNNKPSKILVSSTWEAELKHTPYICPYTTFTEMLRVIIADLKQNVKR